jgi:preprotein translocase subunit SecG
LDDDDQLLMQSGGGGGGGAGGGIGVGNNGLFNETGADSRAFFIFFKCGYFFIYIF